MNKILTRGCLGRKARPEKGCLEKLIVLFAQELHPGPHSRQLILLLNGSVGPEDGLLQLGHSGYFLP